MPSQGNPSINGQGKQINCDWSLPLSSAFLVMQEICDGPFYIEKADQVSDNGPSLFFSFREKNLISYKKERKELASFIKHYGSENDCKKVLNELNQSRLVKPEPKPQLTITPKETSDGHLPGPATSIGQSIENVQQTCKLFEPSATKPQITTNNQSNSKLKNKKQTNANFESLRFKFDRHIRNARQRWINYPESLLIEEEKSEKIKEILTSKTTNITTIVNRLADILIGEDQLADNFLKMDKSLDKPRQEILDLEDQKRLKKILKLIHPSIFVEQQYFRMIKNKINSHGRHLAGKLKKSKDENLLSTEQKLEV